MSPAGIPMFYGASERDTAIAEVMDKDDDVASVGRFVTSDDAWIVDLDRLPEVPSTFDEDRQQRRNPLRFLHGFRYDFRQAHRPRRGASTSSTCRRRSSPSTSDTTFATRWATTLTASRTARRSGPGAGASCCSPTPTGATSAACRRRATAGPSLDLVSYEHVRL
jgi:hypothetical protein